MCTYLLVVSDGNFKFTLKLVVGVSILCIFMVQGKLNEYSPRAVLYILGYTYSYIDLYVHTTAYVSYNRQLYTIIYIVARRELEMSLHLYAQYMI